MPLPNYGYENQEKKTHQDLVFEMAPEIVSDDENSVVNGKKVKSLRGKVSPFFKSQVSRMNLVVKQYLMIIPFIFLKELILKVTTGKIGIDLERTLKINDEKDPDIWKTVVDPK